MKKFLIKYLRMIRVNPSHCEFEEHIKVIKAPSSTQAIIELCNELTFSPIIERLQEV